MASSKPIQEQIYKSRLTITYRTTITGTLQEETLPFRLLVLGAFAGRTLREAGLLDELPKRPVRTIKRGRSVDDHMREMIPVWSIPAENAKSPPSPELRKLRSAIPGSVKIESLTVTVPAGLPEDKFKDLPVRGTALFSSEHTENGFCDFEDQKLKVVGTISLKGPSSSPSWDEAKLELKLKAIAIGDRLDKETRSPIGKVVGLPTERAFAKGEGILAGWKTDLLEDSADGGASAADDKPQPMEWKLTPSDAERFDVELERAVPFTSMRSFSPDAITESIPEIERVRLLKRLLARLTSELRNRPELRNELKKLLPSGPRDPERSKKLENFSKLREALRDKLPALQLDMSAAGPAGAGASGATGPTGSGASGAGGSVGSGGDGTSGSGPVGPGGDGGGSAGAGASGAAGATGASQSIDVEFVDALVRPIHATTDDLYTKDPEDPPNTLWAIVRPLSASGPLKFDDRDTSITESAWLMNGLAVFLFNIEAAAKEIRRRDGRKEDKTKAFDDTMGSYPQFLDATSTMMRLAQDQVRKYLDAVYHDRDFQRIERAWRGLADIASSVESDDVYIDFLDVGPEELYNDIVDHDLDMFSGEIFNKVYVGEYDRYGGKPFAAMIGLYGVDSTESDIRFLRAMGRVANAAHCPFIAAVTNDFFKPYKTMEEVAEISDLDAVLADPQFGKWQELRDTEYAAYLGLTLPRYLVRMPWKPEALGNDIGYLETVPYSHASQSDDDSAEKPLDDEQLKENLLWGYASVLFAKNMVTSYQGSGWAQYIRGPRGGGLCEGLVSYKYTKNGYEEIQPPVEIAIPDYRELQFASNGFIPLVHKKGEAVATFFSAQSLKKPKKFVEDLATKNAALVTNLAYTFSITRIAHYVKRMMREYIGANAEGPYIQKVLAAWLGQYVTIVSNPDDLTLRYYPFKAATVDVQPKPGPLGWYKSVIKILPHIQFEGMDVELQLEAALGGP